MTFAGLLGGMLVIFIGLVLVFNGYGFWRFALMFGGFVAGYAAGAALIPDSQWLLEIIVGVIVAIAAGVLAYFLWSISVVLAGLIYGAAIGAAVLVALGLSADGIIVLAGAVVGAIVGTLLAYFFKDKVIIVLTAFAGASAVTYGITLMFPFLVSLATTDPNSGFLANVVGFGLQTINIIVIVVLGLLGTIIQWVVYRVRFTGELYFEEVPAK